MSQPQPSRPFELVVDQVDPPAASPPPQAAPPQKPPVLNLVAIEMMRIALIALGQKALIALAACFTLLTVGSAFWLWMSIPDPNPHQLISLSIYAGLVLAINVIVRRR